MKYLSILFFFIVLSVSAQPQAPNRVDSKGNKQGPWKKYDKNVLLYEGNFKDNVPVGEFKYYHPNGKLKSITFFIQGVHQVKTTIYHPNEKKASEGQYIDQIKDGEWSYWDEDGTLIRVEHYKKGIKEGIWKTFSAQTGILLEEVVYLNDQLHGTAKTYYTDGTPCTVENYINNQRNGEAESYYGNGILSIKGSFHKGLKLGTWNYYDEEGKLRKTVGFKNSQPDTTFLTFYLGSKPVKLWEANIAYFMLDGNKVLVVMKNGNKVTITDDMSIVRVWADILNFVPATPNLHVAVSAIKGYRELGDGAISVEIEPALPYQLISRGDEAAMVKMLFNKELPKVE
jgi:antitoxin component YwqK of YwqJK toxin-antitoxin module